MEFQAFIAEWVSEGHRAAITQALFQVSQQFEQEYSFTANGNARYGRMEPVPDEEKEITLDAVMDEEVPGEDLWAREADDGSRP